MAFDVIEGGRADRIRVGNVVFALADREAVTHRRVLYAEDRHLVLSAEPVVPERTDAPLRVLTAALDDEPRPLGRIITKKDRWMAVIHDLDETPTTTPERVAAAFRQAFHLAEARDLARLAVEPLGSIHGPLELLDSVKLCLAALEASPFEALQQVDFIAPLERTPRRTLEHYLGTVAKMPP